MFDISFSELIVIAVVALVVIGPEKLPKVARAIGLLVGRVQRFASQVKDEVNREARFEDLQRLQGEVQQSILSVADGASKLMSDIKTAEVSHSKPVKKTSVSKSKSDEGIQTIVKSKSKSSAQTKSPKTKQPTPVATKRASKVSRTV